MSAFEVKVTPPRSKPSQENREPTDVTMAPFSEKSIVTFENVPLTKTAIRLLRIHNPSNDPIQVRVIKNVRPEHKVILEWTENIVPALSTITMEIKWTPDMNLMCKDTLQLIDNRNFRKDIAIVLKTKINDSIKQNVRKFPTVSSGFKSVLNGGSVQLKKPMSTTEDRNPKKPLQRNRRSMIIERSDVVHENLQQMPDNQSKKILVVLPKNNGSAFVPNITITTALDNSPVTSVDGVLNMIDELQFTPVAANRNTKPRREFENISLLSTPNMMCNSDNTKLTQVKPRCLGVDLLDGEKNITFNVDPIKDDTKHSTSIVNNKTFDVKHTDNMELSIGDDSVSSINADFIEGNSKTTISETVPTVGCTLGIIPEDESENNCNLLISKPNAQVNKNENLLRDVELIGNPLRKCSKSLKDLHQRPNTNNITQGSLPNLNEMETIRIFEQNRYFKRAPNSSPCHLNISNNNQMCAVSQLMQSNKTSKDATDCIDISLLRHPEVTFNQYEILAQSSRFNLNETNIDRKCKSAQINKTFQFNREQMTPLQKKNYNKNLPEPTYSASKRRACEVMFNVDFTSINNGSNKMLQPNNGINYDNTFISPPKRQRLDTSITQHKLKQRNQATPTNASCIRGVRQKTWSHVQMKNVKQIRTLALARKPITPRKQQECNSRNQLYDSEFHMQININPDPFAATTTCDPFLAATMYLDEASVERYQIDLKKWLNALVTIPAELKTGDMNTKIDVGKLFNEARNKELVLAPTKEMQSINYFNNFRLETLRRSAIDLYLSEEMCLVCSKVIVYVNKHSIRIRHDRNLHLDIVTQREMLELLLCFNSLWLRLGLEVVFGEKIHLQSNCDIVGLSSFILNRLFRDKRLEQQYCKAYALSDEYAELIKKFTLQKFLLLLLFLDKAKGKRIIAHDPCLFVKKSPYKETREILLKFSAELLANVGDITRQLKRLDYVLTHKQSYLDEFDYAFNNLAIDLRDGIRLTRVMEIILLREDLTRQLRVPAISRLQRIFNVNLALKALTEADFQLSGSITAQDIVDGHREKTLSLLWQIIYKFRSPKFHAAARTLQIWWRKSWLKIVINRRIREKIERRRQRAATVIQSAYRGYINRKYVKMYRSERTEAVITIQKYVRRYLAQKRLAVIIRSILIIQYWFRACKLRRICRNEFMQLRKSVAFVQKCWRLRKEARTIRAQALRDKIQREKLKQEAAIKIQTCWRRYVARKNFLHIKAAIIRIQRGYRSYKCMKAQHYDFQKLRQKTLIIQRFVRARQAMKRHLHAYRNIRNAIITTQRWYRGVIAMRQQRIKYKKIQSSIRYIQHKWRATLLMRKLRRDYATLKTRVIGIQQLYRAKKQMQIDYSNYQQLKIKVLWVQRFYRNKLRMRYERDIFKKTLQAVRIIQQHYRAYKLMRYERAKFCDMKNATICLQQYIRNYLQMKCQRQKYLKMKYAAQTIQRHFRSYYTMKRLRHDFLHLKSSTIRVQRRFRGKRLMRYHVNDYQRKRFLIIAIQRRYRAKLLGRQIRQQYLAKRLSIIQIQQRYRALKIMKKEKTWYQHVRSSTIMIQQYYRGYLQMKEARLKFLRKREAATKIQIWYRSILNMQHQRQLYLQKVKTIILLQNKWRAILKGRKQRLHYLNIRCKVILLQCKMKATIQMRLQRAIFKRQKEAAITLQRYFRNRREMLKARAQYQSARSLIVWTQRKYRAKIRMIKERNNFLHLRSIVIDLQRRYRARKAMHEERARFMKFKISLVCFQAFARGYLARQRFQILTSPEGIELLRQNRAAKVIQRVWRGYRVRKRLRNTVLIQIRRNIELSHKTSNAVNAVSVKIQDAIKLLRGRHCVADAIGVLKRLDNISRTVPHLMIKSSDYISTFCYGIMAQSIRSETDKYLVMYCSRILLNLARYNNTTANTFQENGLVTIAQMLLRWCSKDCDIFNILCTLIWIFAHCPTKRKIIHDFMTTTDAVYMVRETKKLVARKEKMKQNVRKPNILQQQQQQRSIKRQYNFPSCTLPHFEPDYGVMYNKPYTFVSSIFAFDTILSKLGIQIY